MQALYAGVMQAQQSQSVDGSRHAVTMEELCSSICAMPLESFRLL